MWRKVAYYVGTDGQEKVIASNEEGVIDIRFDEDKNILIVQYENEKNIIKSPTIIYKELHK